MDKPNVIKDKSFDFAADMVLFCGLLKDMKQYELSRQVIRSGTSIGANVEEALESFTRKDFAYRMSVASREARETVFWLRVIKEAKLLPPENVSVMLTKAAELKKILISIVKTTQESLDKKL